MSELREYVVTLHQFDDLESFYADMETEGGNLYIPDRAVDIALRRPISRNTNYLLTDQEAEQIRQDPRVLAVELTLEEQGIGIKRAWTQTTSAWSKSYILSQGQVNWGLLRATEGRQRLNWGTGGTPEVTEVTGTVTVPFSGKNVDVIISDDTVDGDHIEFAKNIDGTGGQRFVNFDWFSLDQTILGVNPFVITFVARSNGTVTITVLSAIVLILKDDQVLNINCTSDPSFNVTGVSIKLIKYTGLNSAEYLYTFTYLQAGPNVSQVSATGSWSRDYEYTVVANSDYHGTFCTGIAAGNTQGWARDANIYNFDIFKYGILLSFDYIRAWHNAKSINPATGLKNPSIINASWVMVAQVPPEIENITSVVYRNTPYVGPFTEAQLNALGVGTFGDGTVVTSVRNTALEEDIRDCIADGIIIVAAAGNEGIKIDLPGGADYNNILTAGAQYKYNQGCTPAAANNVICVGAVGTAVNASGEEKATYSQCGPRIDVFAPGSNIRSAVPSNYTINVVSDTRNSNFKISYSSGTSFASPQVTGILATMLEETPSMNQAAALSYITDNAKTGQLIDIADDPTVYTVGLNGAPNRYLFAKYPAVAGVATYTITSAASVNEGESLTFTVITTNVTDGTSLYWTVNNGTSSNADFSAISGSFTINNNTGSFIVTAIADLTTELSETFTVSIRTISTSGSVVATSNSVTINDTSTTPAGSNDATLSALTISNVTLSPTFNSTTTSYTASVANSIGSVTVTPTRNESNASIAITFNGSSVTSGSTNTLNVGSNTIAVVVTAQDGTTTKTYTVVVTRAAPTTPTLSSDATLSALTISNVTLTPSFSSGIISYTASVANGISSVTVTPTRNQSDASIAITVNGSSVNSGSTNTLNVGSNTIAVVVTAQDGTTTKTYTVVVTRAQPPISSDATLSALTFSSGPSNFLFNSGTTSYTDAVANRFDSVTVTPIANESNATIKVNNTTVTSGTASNLINLNVGPNTITIVVTAQDRQTIKTYTIVLTRLTPPLSNNATLSSLTISRGLLIPSFNPNTPSYKDFVMNGVSSVTVTPTRNEPHATITVNGSSVTSGTASDLINLTVGSNTITVIVTAQDGLTMQVYAIKVIREIGSDEWVNGSYLGSISTGVISDLAVLAREIKSDYTIKYQLISGALPNGLTLARDGTIVGSAEYGTAGDYLFTVLASDIYEFGSIARTFSLTVIEVTDTKYTSIYVRPFLPQEKRKEYQDFIGNSFTFDPSLIYRYFDPNFGVQHDIKMVIDFGIEQLNLDQYAIALRQNFYRRTFYFGDVKTAIASDSTGNIIYEVVYVDIIDNIQGAAETFNNNSRNYYPASIDNMRKQLNSIQLPDYSTIKVNRDLLPKFMDTPQPGEYQVPNYMHIVPLCYALPGQGSRIVSRIKLSGFNFKQLSFEVDRLVVQNSLDSSSAKYLLLERQSLSDAIKSDNVLYEGTFDWQFDDNVVLTRN